MTSGKLVSFALFFTMMSMLIHVSLSAPQCSSTSLVTSNFTTLIKSTVDCPIGYAPDIKKLQCRPFDQLWNETYGQPCSSSSDCSMSFTCGNNKCVPYKTRALGDSCLDIMSCYGDLNCYQGQCTPLVTHEKVKKLGERCGNKDFERNIINECVDGLDCVFHSDSSMSLCSVRRLVKDGEFCGYNLTENSQSDCTLFSKCDRTSSKCVPTIYTAKPGESCDNITPNGYILCIPGVNCDYYNRICKTTVLVKFGEKCNYNINGTYYMCDSSMECDWLQSKCINRILSDWGGVCDVTNSTTVYHCRDSSLWCSSSRCIFNNLKDQNFCGVNSTGTYSCADTTQQYCYFAKCLPKQKQGNVCPTYDACESNLQCRKLNATSSQQTCETAARRGEYCSSERECESGLSCTNSKCSLYAKREIGESCTNGFECASSRCLQGVCSFNVSTITCSSDIDCYSYSGKCSCSNGEQTSDISVGHCYSLFKCSGYLTNLQNCIFNNGKSAAWTLYFDRDSSIHKSCTKEYSEYYSCSRELKKERAIETVLPIQGLTVNTPIQTFEPERVKLNTCGLYTNTDSFVCTGNGLCIGNNICKCDPGWSGTDCETKMSSPPNPPQPTRSIIYVPAYSENIGNPNNRTISGANLNGFHRDHLYVLVLILLLVLFK